MMDRPAPGHRGWCRPCMHSARHHRARKGQDHSSGAGII